jgi:hypothetical protein
MGESYAPPKLHFMGGSFISWEREAGREAILEILKTYREFHV